MNKKLYRNLAITNLKKNASMMLPYLITCVFVVSFYYIVSSLSLNVGLKTVSGGNFIVDVMKFGSLLFAGLSLLFLFYTNSFIMKRRKKEIGLYHILGLEKRHIRKVLSWENAICSFGSIACGLMIGVGSNQILTIGLSKMIGTELPFSGAISGAALAKTLFTFMLIFWLIFLYNLRQIYVANPVELLKGEQFGEKEPKERWLLTVLGTGLLICGYTLSFLVNDPIKDRNMIVVAIICVLIATYLLFIAISISILKLLRRNEDFYYKSKNFTLISGMLYRMKQNAVGLSNISILSTATLFVMTITLSLYFGINNMLENSFNHDISIVAPAEVKKQQSELQKFVKENKKNYSLQTENILQYTGGKFAEDFNGDGKSDFFFLMPLEEFNRLTNQDFTLSRDEVLVYSENPAVDSKTFSFAQNKVRVKEYLNDFPVNVDSSQIYGLQWIYIVSKHDGLLADYFGPSGASELYYEFDFIGKDDDKSDFSYVISEKAESLSNLTVESKFIFSDSLIRRFGGLLFLGILVSIILFMQTALSIFYKQISEGYEDKKRFNIIKKVGMSHKEIHSTIRRQILIVFFSPLLIALLHLFIALPMIMKLLKIAFMNNWMVIISSSIVSAIVFVLIYSAVFLLTERSYRKIVDPSIHLKEY